MEESIVKRTVLITGASSGIGYEFAKIFARKSYNLVLVARRKEKLEELANKLQSLYETKSLIIAKDLSVQDAPGDIFDELEKKSIDINVIVNNAGTQVYGLFQKTELEQEIDLLKLNIISLTQLTKLASKKWIANGKKGKILNIGSTASFMPVPLNSIYSASKAYVLSFSEGISKDLKGTGITVTTLCPGATKTEFFEKANMTNARISSLNMMSAEEVARIGYKGLMKGKRIIVPGVINKMMVFLVKILPRNMVLAIGKYVME